MEKKSVEADVTLDFCPETLRGLANESRTLSVRYLRGLEHDGAAPEAAQFFLLAMAALDQAAQYAQLASLKQSQAIAALR